MSDGLGLTMLLNGFMCKVDDSEVLFISVYMHVFYLYKPCVYLSRIYFVHFDNRVTGDSHVSKTEKTCLTILMKYICFMLNFVFTHIYMYYYSIIRQQG